MFMRSTKEIVGRLIDRTRPDGRGIRDGFRKVSFDVRLAPTFPLRPVRTYAKRAENVILEIEKTLWTTFSKKVSHYLIIINL